MGRVTGSEGHELGLLPCDPNSVCLQCRSRPPDSDIILCDHCESEWHMLCLRPPMACVPEGEWICPDCPGRKAGPENGQGDGHVNGQSEIPMTSSKGTSQRPVLGAQAKSPREEGTPGTPGASGAGPVAERGIKGHRVSSGSGLNRKRKAGLVPKSENADSAGAVVPLKDLGSFLACAICLETLEHPISVSGTLQYTTCTIHYHTPILASAMHVEKRVGAHTLSLRSFEGCVWIPLGLAL